MYTKNFKFKIVIIFLLPALALIYFSFYFIDTKQKELKEAKNFIVISNSVKMASAFIHNIQLERGLSAGYIVANDKNTFWENLKRQYLATDLILKKLMPLMKKASKRGDTVDKLDRIKRLKATRILAYLDRLQNIRRSVLSASLTFDQTIEYYTKINDEVIDIIRIFTSYNYHGLGYTADIYKIEQFKEQAGLERAYIYHCLLSKSCATVHISNIRRLIERENLLIKDFIVLADQEDANMFKTIFQRSVDAKVHSLRKAFFGHKLSKDHAKEWFGTSTDRIDDFEKITLMIVNRNYNIAKQRYHKAKNDLYMTVFLWSLSIVAFLLLLYILNKLIQREVDLMARLRIASYAFDSHEAMTITMPTGEIVKVNKAFTAITGYSEKEAIGKNPNILKSGRHPEVFYKKMWDSILKTGSWKGEIYNKRKNGEIYPERLSITAIKDKEDNITHYIAQFLDITDIKSVQERVLYQANHDYMTGLPNRKHMLEQLQEQCVQCKEKEMQGAFLFIDLDDFKKINDQFGHAFGDKILLNIAHRLRENFETQGILARISGDEFCLILHDLDAGKAESMVIETCKSILLLLSSPFVIDKQKIKISVSIGIRLFATETDDVNRIIDDADTAMYRAKEEGKNRFVFFDKRLQAEIQEREVLKAEIKRGLEQNEFIFYFQPRFHAINGTIESAELLVRWMHPDGEIYEPGDFLDRLKEMNMISEITLKALHASCQFLDNYRDLYSGSLSINITGCELATDGFIEETIAMVTHYGIDPASLEFEIVEDELIRDFDQIIAGMNVLRSFGVQFSIDDFGQGYSSITYLKKLPVETLKIDSFFVQELDQKENRALLEMIIRIAKTFQMSVVIEGIEEISQLELVRPYNADQYQGDYFSRPISKESFVSLLLKKKEEVGILPSWF